MNEEITIIDALDELRPGAEWSIDNRDYNKLVWLDKTQTKPTEDEVNAKLAELNNELPMKLLREERNRRLQATDWRASVDLTLSNDWKAYRQDLRSSTALSCLVFNSTGSGYFLGYTFLIPCISSFHASTPS